MQLRDSLETLALAVNYTAFDDRVADVYEEQLAGYDARDVNAACKHLARISQWWPKVSEMHRAINEQRSLREHITRGSYDYGPTYRCHHCQDTKWRIRECSGAPMRECGRTDAQRDYPLNGRDYSHAGCSQPHTFADRCLCSR